ncbi:MAG: type II toxin-antitoxin system VapC family toxin [Anaerolineae bacterium]|nr:type II toxin-antitoxin system VapC family toxin [Anaerolineae bacterium]
MPNSPICVDASFMIRLLESDEDGLPVQLWRRWQAEGRLIVAPTLLDYEIVNALHRYTMAGHLTSAQAEEALEALLGLGIIPYSDETLHLRALQIAGLLGLSAAYDAHYLALSERLNAEFWTADRRLFLAVEHRWPRIHLLYAG